LRPLTDDRREIIMARPSESLLRWLFAKKDPVDRFSSLRDCRYFMNDTRGEKDRR